MSKPDEAFKAPQRNKMQKLRTPHMRALRKELLIARADVERMELRQATADLRSSVTHFSFLRFLMPKRSNRGWNRRGASSGGIMETLSTLLGGGGGIGVIFKQYPIIGSIASLILAKPVRTRVVSGAKPLLKWGGLGFAAWEGWRIYQQMKNPSTETPSEAADPTVF
jgi:hypothetical protein